MSKPKFTDWVVDKDGDIVSKSDGLVAFCPLHVPIEATHLIAAAPNFYDFAADKDLQELLELAFESGGQMKRLSIGLNKTRLALLAKARGEQ